MPVLRCVVFKHVGNSAHKSCFTVLIYAQFLRHAIRALKAYAVYLVTEPVRICLCDVNTRGAPSFIDLNGGCRSEKVTEEHHCRADPRLGPEVLTDLLCFFQTQSGNIGQPIGMVFKHVERVVTEFLNNFECRLFADSLYST